MTGIATPTTGSVVSVAAFGSPVAEVLNGFISSVRAVANSNLTLTTSEQDVPGASVSVTVQGANAYALVLGTFNFDSSVVPSNESQYKGRLNVDGSTQSTEATATSFASVGGAFTSPMIWKIPLTAGTAHTLKLVALRTSTTGTLITGTSTNIVALVFDIP